MNKNATRDFLVGLFVLSGIAALGYLSLSVGGASFNAKNGTTLYAVFDQVADLKPRAPVEMAGVKVGQVTAVNLDEDYRARVELVVDERYKIPADSSAAIVTAGILGDRYLALEPGGEDLYLQSGEQIAYTESALVLERLVGKFLHNFKDSDD